MTEEEKKIEEKKKVEETLGPKKEEVVGTTKIEPGVKQSEVKPTEVKIEEVEKIVSDDYEVILDNRGMYKIGKWWIKVRRINVQEMIMGWGVVSSVFGNIEKIGLDLKDFQAWAMLFVTAIPVVPGKFYQFLAQIMELQYDESLPQAELKVLRDEYNVYLRRNLKTEELLDVFGLIYKQEEKRIDDLAKKVQSLFGPIIKMMMKKAKEEKK